MTQKQFHTYDAATGQINGSYSFSASKAGDIALNTQPGEANIEVAEHGRRDTHYIDLSGPTLVDRPVWNPFPTSGDAPLSVDATDAPSGTVLTVVAEGGTSVDVTDFTAPIEFVDDGVYDITVTPPFPYQVVKQKVTVT